jgi:2-hydroxy-4-carboxymuconate semialdehyde hemiacetal dehydrogenase
MKICLAGEGAQAETHMQALSEFSDIEVVSLAAGIEEDARTFASKWQIPYVSTDLASCLQQPGVEAVILTTPSQQHFQQVTLAMNMGKHVQVEIPMALSLQESQELATLEQQTGLTCMVSHTRHYNSPLRELHRMVQAGEWTPHHIVLETYFFRRVNLNRFGQPRTWKDDLLWHHGCHAVDLAYWLLADPDMDVWGQVGPNHSELDIPMDLTIGMRSKSGALVTVAHSFNQHGPIQVRQRFIGEQQSYIYEGGKLSDSEGNIIMQTNMNESVINQNKEFFSAIAESRPTETSFTSCLPVMKLLDDIEKSLTN